ncbi:MAG: hypothetical protein QMD13_10175, partial [Candidatus Bathyarchaeia archaeon]|nr:hypothetical protein [Candidatus Bathyarchaeia archaeon]
MTFRSYYSGTDASDFVDNNTSDVDSSADKGIHSNFTAQQYGPDDIFDTLTEADTAGGGTTYPVTNMNFTADATGWTYGEASDENNWASGTWSSTGGRTDAGCYDLHVADPSAKILDTQIDRWIDYSFSVTTIPTSASVYAGYKTVISDVGKSTASSSSKIQLVHSNGTVFTLYTGPAVNTSQTDYDYQVIDAGAYFDAVGTYTLRLFTTGDTGTKAANKPTIDTYWDDAGVSLTYPSNYELDLEVQWTTADYQQTYEYLCIKTGTLGAESLSVDVWNGSAWINIFTDLTANSWNNVSVSSYLISSTFTIRFKGATETGDTTQDSWDIDVTLLHVWSNEYASEVEFTGLSNMEDWSQLNWTVNSAWTISSVSVTLQLYNYTLSSYPTGGNGYIAYTSNDTPNTDENKSQTINVNPTHFRNATGYWKMKIKGVKATDTQFDFKADWIEFKVMKING